MVKVVKFGGSSLASAEQFKKAGDIIRSEEDRKYVVPSAPGKRNDKDTKVTDLLYKCYDEAEQGKDYTETLNRIRERYDEIIKGLGLKLDLSDEFKTISAKFKNKAGRQYAASRGEYLNGMIMADYLGFTFLDAAEVVLFDDDGNFLSEDTNTVLSRKLKELDNVVMPGFYGATRDGVVKTFSRGGSDISGSILARAASADLYENWTDVSGFLVADPRVVKDPEVINIITYKELRELSYMGATVLHEDAIFPVRRSGIPINIRNTNKPDDPGTLIVENTCKSSDYTITGIAGKKGFVSVNIEKDMMNSEIGFGRRALEAFELSGINFEHVPSGIDTLSVIVHQPEFEGKEQQVLAALHRLTDPDSIDIDSDIALIAVVGRSMRANRGVAARIFAVLAHNNVNIKMIDQGSSELNIIIGVSNNDFETAIRAIYDIFVTSRL
ncbi:MAG: aspartate kinase [Lachnospiraceae bacterium]|nr:aspartate kinase [Lachnospiraceae bacterium]